jgi:mannosyltransferase
VAERPDDDAPDRRVVQRANRWVAMLAGSAAWAVPGVIAAGLGLLLLGRPGLWGDELATWGTASLPWRQQAGFLRQVDAVLAPYYAAMKTWMSLFGDSDVALRLPSVIAMAAAAAAVGLLGSRLDGRRTGLFAGILFAILPVVSRYGQEARPYAFVVLFAAVSTLVLLGWLEPSPGRRQPARRRLVAYSAMIACVGLSNVVGLLVLAAHAALVVARGDRRLVRTWLAAAIIGTIPVLPVLALGLAQKSQVAWLATFHLPPEAYLTALGGSVLGGVLVVALVARSHPPRTATSWLLVTWAAAPPLLLLALSPVMPLMLPRYLLCALPAWAILAGMALARLRLPLALAGLVVIGAFAVPQHRTVRGDAGHEGQTTRALATIISTHFQPGDGIVFGQADGRTTCCLWLARDAIAHYVPPGRRPRDLFLREPQRIDGQFAALEYPDLIGHLGRPQRIWVVRLGYATWQDPLYYLGDGKDQLIRAYYQKAEAWYPAGFVVALYVPRAA